MAKSFVLFLLCLSSVYADTEIKMDKNMASEKMDDATMVETAKLKRDSWPVHSTPCPPSWPHYHKGWMPEHPKVQFVHQPNYVHKPVVTVVKPHVPSHQPGWQSPDPWQQSSGWNKPSHGWPMSSGWQSPGWQSGWKAPSIPSHGWQSPGWQSGWKAPSYPSHGWQSKVVIQKPVHSYAPQYHKPMYHVPEYHHKPVIVKPDCPPYEHHNPHHTGIVYAPQHQYQHHQPEIVKVVKPAYHHPQPVYHQPAPVYHHPAPVYNHHAAPAYHHSSPVHIPKVEICDK